MGRSNLVRIFLLLSSSISFSIALSFNFASFESAKTGDLTLNGDAYIAGAGLDLNRDAISSAGRALYRKPMQLWVTNHGNTAVLADFSTNFAIDVFSTASSSYSGGGGGGGFSFVMVPDQDSSWSPSSYGGLLGLFNSNASALDGDAGQQHPVVAVEFDEGLDPAWDFSSDHVGIDVNSLKSKRYVNLTAGGFINMGTAKVWVDYNSTSKNLSVSFALTGNLGSFGDGVFHIVDLRDVLPQRVQLGFTASTGSSSVVIHRITSWSFSSPDLTIPSGKMNIWIWVGAGFGGFVVILILIGGIGICLWRRSNSWTNDRVIQLGNRVRSDQVQHEEDLANCGVEEVPYKLICELTSNFHSDFLIGVGGSGEVFRCRLSNPERDVAVKKIKRGLSRQGWKEFKSELAVVSEARHKNVIQLVCLSCGDGNLLLCFELMPNGSFKSHLHTAGPPLPWKTRYKIMLEVASGVEYLHTGLSPLVVHRDIKSDNVLLDAHYNAKVADFGFARFIELNQSMKTTDQIGTWGYLAPEVLRGEKASPESDVYSLGKLLLEAVTGKHPTVDLLSFVRNKDNILASVDERLGVHFDRNQAERLLAVGLLCCDDDPVKRPKISEVKGMLDGCVPLNPRSFSLAGPSSTSEYHLPPAAVAPAPTPALAPAVAPPPAPTAAAVSHFRRSTIA